MTPKGAGGKPLPAFSLDDCTPVTGDFIEHIVTWKSGADVGALAGRAVRVRFVVQEADLYSFQFNS